jgi:hypothetical protein
MNPALPWYQTRQGQNQKRKLWPNFLNKNRHKNSQQNSCKPNSTTPWIDHTSWLSCFHSRNARIVQHTQINKGNAAHKRNQRQKLHDHINRCTKAFDKTRHPFMMTLNSGPCTCFSGSLPLQPLFQSFLLRYFSNKVLCLRWNVLDHNVPNSHSPCNWDDRLALPYPILLFEMGFCGFFAQAGLKPQSSQSPPPNYLGLQV